MAAPSRSFPFLVPNGLARQETGTQPLRILLVNDGSSMLDVDTLQSAGYYVHSTSTVRDALRDFQFARPDLILLGFSLPGTEGKTLLRTLREWTNAPIIVMSARAEESESIVYLDQGADDYLRKPFTTGELLARLRAALRRAFGVPRSEIFNAGGLQLDFSERTVFVRGEQVRLTATEYDLLKVLASHAGAVRTYCQLIRELWGGTQYQDAMHLLRVTMSNLRRKLMDGSGLIVTEPGVGYRLRRDSDWA